MTSVKIRDFDFSIKTVKPDGYFAGWASVYGVVDSDNEIVAPGAFDESLATRAAKGRKLPVLWQHRSDMPIGAYELVKSEGKGLYVEGNLLVQDVVLARESHALITAEVVTGLSIGYRTRASTYDETTGVRTLTKLDLEEVSLVTFPSNDDARIEAVKFKLAHGGLPTLSEFERFLRDSGFSRSQSAVIAGRGLKHLLRDVEAEPANINALAERLNTFKLPTL